MSVPSSNTTYTYEKPKSEMPRTVRTFGAPVIAVMIGYVTWSSMMSGLRSHRERMMTWVSLRSGVASSGRCIIDHAPQMQAAATNAKTRNLFRTEKPMTRLIILTPRSGIGCGLYFVIQIFGRIRLELVSALVRAKCERLAVVDFRM